MESHAVIKELLQKIPAKQLAGELGVSLSLVYKWAESQHTGAGTSNPLDRVELLARFSDNATPVRWLCERLGGIFVQTAETTDSSQTPTIQPTVCRITNEMARMLSTLGEILGANAVSSATSADLCARWSQLRPLIDSFVLASTRGEYRPDDERCETAPPWKNHSDTLRNHSIDSRKYKRRFAKV